MGEYSRSFYRTDLGWGAVVATASGLVEVMLPFNCGEEEACHGTVVRRFPGATAESGLTGRAAELLTEYFAGGRVAFDLPVAVGHGSAFRDAVVGLVRGIPYGMVKTYADVAREAGSPRGARGVGAVMARNPLPIIIPCHRVVGSNGAMTGYSASGGVASKVWLLTLEGVLAPAHDTVILTK